MPRQTRHLEAWNLQTMAGILKAPNHAPTRAETRRHANPSAAAYAADFTAPALVSLVTVGFTSWSRSCQAIRINSR